LEIAACCDIRIAGASSRFGIPIAKLGFPLAPLEAQMVSRVLPLPLLRELLLEARLMEACGNWPRAGPRAHNARPTTPMPTRPSTARAWPPFWKSAPHASRPEP
jgi:hypothetical protein